MIATPRFQIGIVRVSNRRRAQQHLELIVNALLGLFAFRNIPPCPIDQFGMRCLVPCPDHSFAFSVLNVAAIDSRPELGQEDVAFIKRGLKHASEQYSFQVREGQALLVDCCTADDECAVDRDERIVTGRGRCSGISLGDSS